MLSDEIDSVYKWNWKYCESEAEVGTAERMDAAVSEAEAAAAKEEEVEEAVAAAAAEGDEAVNWQGRMKI